MQYTIYFGLSYAYFKTITHTIDLQAGLLKYFGKQFK